MKNLIKYILIVVALLIASLLLVKPTLKNISYGIELQGGFEVLYRIEPLVEGEKLTQEDLDNTYKAIVNRIDTLGVSEPVIAFEGDNLLRVQLPGVSNEEEARDRISTTAVLSFRDTEDNLLMTSDILGKNGAKVSQNNKTFYYQVSLDIKDSKTFYDVTKEVSKKSNDQNKMVIWLDFDPSVDSYESEKDTCGKDGNLKCISAPYVNDALSSDVVIDGTFTKEDAQYLVDLINSGSLPTKLIEESTPRNVSASFGSSTIQKTGIAGIITLIIISLILIFKYRISGLIGSICLIIYSLLVFIIFNAVGGVLTLTGIAALVLGVGMAVDSIIISTERIKDELNQGKNLISSYKEGNKSSLVAIIDANITTLIAGVILYIFGESSVRGFATMLIITIIVTIITTVILYRMLLGLFIKSKMFNKKEVLLLGNQKKKPNIDFNKNSKYAIYLSLSIMIIGIVFFFINGFNFGVDFTGGTNIILTSNDNLDFISIKDTLKEYTIVDYGTYIGSDNEGYIKINNVLDETEELDIKNKLENMNLEVSLNEISTLVTKNLTENAIRALIYSILAIIIYVAIRFNLNFAISGILMLIHDVFIILSFFIIFKIEVSFILVAALLTIIGYSINDTIVVFDRIRDNKKKIFKNKKKLTDEDLIKLVNASSNETISRNIWTSITTIVAVVSLLFVKLNSIFTFNIAILIGLIAGSVSSLIIGSKIWLLLESKSMKKPDDEDNEAHELLVKGINS